MSIEKNICDAMEVIARDIVSNADFDKTIQATIVAYTDNGRYKVQYQDSLFYAYTSDLEKTYTKGKQVFVLVPKGDFTQKKTIISEVIEEKDGADLTEKGIKEYEKIGENFIISNQTYKMSSRYEYDESTNEYTRDIYNRNDTQSYANRILQKDNIVETMFKQGAYFYVDATFTTNIAQTGGNFGVRVYITALDKEGNEYQTISELDAKYLTGVNYHTAFNTKAFCAFYKPDNFVNINKIQLFVKDFALHDCSESYIEEHPELLDIEIKNLELYSANRIVEIFNQNGMSLTTPNGTFIYKVPEDIQTRKTLIVEATVYQKGKVVAPESVRFYWFLEDHSVRESSDDGFCTVVPKYSGRGWRCLNRKENGQYMPDINTRYFTSADLPAYQNHIRCIAVTQDDEVYERSDDFYLYNEYKNYKGSLVPYPAETFFSFVQSRNTRDFGVKYIVENLTEGDNTVFSDIQYYWGIGIGENKNEEIIGQAHFQSAVIDNENGTLTNLDFYQVDESISYFTI